MTEKGNKTQLLRGHRKAFMLILCLLTFGLTLGMQAARKKQPRKKVDERVYLEHADRLSYDRFGRKPDAQILNGHVSFRHKGAHLTCDSAYFFEASNSFEAFGHVKMRQGDTLTLNSEYAFYDGNEQMARARRNVVLKHRGTVLYTDSLDYDRLYNLGYFFEGGKMVDKENVLTSDWGEYDTELKEAKFNYNVNLKNKKFLLVTDTLYYDVVTKEAHVVGPSTITSGKSVVNTNEGYFDSRRDRTRLFGRSTLVDGEKEMIGDSLFRDEKKGTAEGFGNVIYNDKGNKNELHCDYFWYDEEKGYAHATKNAVLVDYSQKDTLWLHGDTLKMFSYNLNTDSVWREMHCFHKVRAYRKDVQAVCDSLVYNTKDSVLTMYKDPITWNANRQLLGEKIEVFMKDSTIHEAHVLGQASSIEKVDNENHYNQVSSKYMLAFFVKGEISRSDAVGSVQTIYYPIDEKDSTFHGLNYLETDTMKMYIEQRKLQKIWTNKAKGTTYPMTQIPPSKLYLSNFAWFDYIRPLDKNDIFEWREKKSGTELRETRRRPPLQTLAGDETDTPPAVSSEEPSSPSTDNPSAPTESPLPPAEESSPQTENPSLPQN